MNRISYLLIAAFILLSSFKKGHNNKNCHCNIFHTLKIQTDTIPSNDPKPVYPIPTATQLAWQEMELVSFIHFTTNTFTDLEWGNGNEPESVFNPTSPNPLQWATILKKAGFKELILTCKHHDGFCLWPSKYTEHSIKNSPYKNGKGDLVYETSLACKKAGIKFGIYLSPWDRNHAEYGRPAYITYYRNQLTELITQYGPISELWFDGANGGTGYYGGANERRTITSDYYDWPNTIKLARSLQKEKFIIFSDNGPDVRWVGNEEGWVGETNWNTIDPDSALIRRPGFEKIIGSGMENGSHWIPSEVDVSIRPGWFYHAKEDSLVKTPAQLFNIYLKSVGRGAVLLLNVPPDRRGLFHDKDIQALQGFRNLLLSEFKTDMAYKAPVIADSYRGNDRKYQPSNLTDGNNETYWATDDSVKTGSIILNLQQNKTVKYVILQEYIKLGQRIKKFTVDIFENNSWKQVAEATTIGHKRILQIEPSLTSKIRIRILESKACPLISNIEIY